MQSFKKIYFYIILLGFSVQIDTAFDKNALNDSSNIKKELQEIKTTKELQDLVIGSKGVVVLNFYYADWIDEYGYAHRCPGSSYMLSHLEAVAHKLDDKIKIIKTNYRLVTNTIYRDLALTYNIRIAMLPSQLVFKDGKLQDINTKFMDEKQLYTYFSQFLD